MNKKLPGLLLATLVDGLAGLFTQFENEKHVPSIRVEALEQGYFRAIANLATGPAASGRQRMTLLRHSARSTSVSFDRLDDVGRRRAHGAYLRTYRRHQTIHVLAAWAFSVGEYALVHRAGLSNETCPFRLRLWDKSYNFAHGPLQI